jgi:threonyl-tRNA synthetase
MYAILEASLMKDKPLLPYWLSPIQLRLIPVNDDYLKHCEVLSQLLNQNNVRADIDDRNERLARKIRISEQNWIPYVLVIGKQEMDTAKYNLRDRAGKEISDLNINSVISLLKEQQQHMPYKPLNLNKLVSNQPIFR